MWNSGEGILEFLRKKKKKKAISGERPAWGESEPFDVVVVHTGQLQIPKSRVQVRTGPRRVPLLPHPHPHGSRGEPGAAWNIQSWKRTDVQCTDVLQPPRDGMRAPFLNETLGLPKTWKNFNIPCVKPPQNSAGGDWVDLEPSSKWDMAAGMLMEAGEPRGGGGWHSLHQFSAAPGLLLPEELQPHLPATIPKPFPLLFPFLNNNISKISHPGKKKNPLSSSDLFIPMGFVPG